MTTKPGCSLDASAEKGKAEGRTGRSEPAGGAGGIIDLTVTGSDHSSFFDALTGLRNRRAAEHDLGLAVARAQRSSRPLSIVFLQIDALTERGGTGDRTDDDRVLAEAVTRLRRVLPRDEPTYRVRYDELMLLLVGADASDAEAVVDRCLAAWPGAFSAELAALPAGAEAASAVLERAQRTLDRHHRATDLSTVEDGGDQPGAQP